MISSQAPPSVIGGGILVSVGVLRKAGTGPVRKEMNVGKIKVERFSVGSGSDSAFYDYKTCPEPLYIETTDSFNEYKISLTDGNYSHSGNPAVEGAFEATLATGNLRGYVKTAFFDNASDVAPGSINYTLVAE